MSRAPISVLVMMRERLPTCVATLSFAVLLGSAGCDDSTRGLRVDAGPGVDGEVVGEPPVPIYRLGPRNVSGGFFTVTLSGTIEVPVATLDHAGFAGWQIAGHGPAGTIALEPATVIGDRSVVAFEASVSVSSEEPGPAREILHARSPDGRVVLAAVIGADGEVRFSPESTALQVLARSPVRADDSPFEEVYHAGLRSGDDPIRDAAVPTVVAAITAQLIATGESGVFPSGFAHPDRQPFAALDPAIAQVGPPLVSPASTADRLTIIEATAGAQVAVFGPGGPSPHFITGPDGRASFFWYFPPGEAARTYVRTRTAAGETSAASSAFAMGTPEREPPASPVLEWTAGGGARACGAVAGHWLVFFAGGTELAIGFAARLAGPDGCAALPVEDLPSAASLLHAAQLTPALVIGPPSSTVFPLR